MIDCNKQIFELPKSDVFFFNKREQLEFKIKEFKTEYFNRVFTIYKPYNLDKERKMWYESQVPAQTPYNDNLSELYSSKL